MKSLILILAGIKNEFISQNLTGTKSSADRESISALINMEPLIIPNPMHDNFRAKYPLNPSKEE